MKPHSDGDNQWRVEDAVHHGATDQAGHTHSPTWAVAFASVDAYGRIIGWSREAELLLGWRHAEVLGNELDDILGDAVVPSAATLSSASSLPHAATHASRQEVHTKTRDGRGIRIDVSAWSFPVGDHSVVCIAFRDTSAWRSDSLVPLTAAVEGSTDAILTLTPDGEIVTWSGRAQQMYGYTSEEVQGRPLSRLVPPERWEEAQGWLACAKSGQAVSDQPSVRFTKHGEPLEVLTTLFPIRNEAGVVVGITGVDRDITEQRWMAAALDSVTERVVTALEEAEASAEQSRRFLADAAHQIRNPIAGIQAAAESLLQNPSPEVADRLVGTIVRQTSRAARLVSSLLHLTRIDQGRPVARQPCDVIRACAEEADRVWAVAPHLDVVLRVADLENREPAVDETAFREVLANLLDNATRHAVKSIEIDVRRAEDVLEIRVSDDGPGLDASSAERAFDRFVSLDNSGGSGLGLAIARGLARAHGGDVTYENGSFYIRLLVDEGPVTDEPG